MNTETLKALKSSAKNVGRELEALGYPPVLHTHLLQVLSKAVGFESWNALRTTATVPAKPEAPAPGLPYPKHYVAATYQANGRTVDVLRWEDPIVNLGDGFYVYDAETGQCLTPVAHLLFSTRDVPGYEEIVTLLDRLEDMHRCTHCVYMGDEFEDEQFDDGQACPKDGCHGTMQPFFAQD